jgi:tetratricopeptide (TPR) repeat protein
MSIDSLLQEAISLHGEGHLDRAEVLLMQIRAIEPRHHVACLELARILIRKNRFDEAVRLLEPLVDDVHESAAAVHQKLGLAHVCANRKALALKHFERAHELAPDDAQTLHVIANLQQALGQDKEADVSFRRALALKPLVMIPAAASPPDFRVLFLFAPGAGNTPFRYLIDGARFESNVLSVVNDFDYDVDRLRSYADVVVNLVSDVDQGRDVLALVQALGQGIGKRVINPPQSISLTGRATISTRLAGTPGCLVPQTQILSPAQLRLALESTGSAALTFPLLLRPAGTHGGKDFEKLEDADAVDAFVRDHPSHAFYVTPFVDYRSRDGKFRKYRFIYVGDEIFPYHLAIDGRWKVHHATTPMAAFPWMQDEERAFLADPWHVFGSAQQAALRSIRETIALDYFGIDCALMPNGDVLVFEVNASMLVHDSNQQFAYRKPAVERIKRAFHSLLASTA